jgi:formylglycine-generating enzyme required for sulfatase activity
MSLVRRAVVSVCSMVGLAGIAGGGLAACGAAQGPAAGVVDTPKYEPKDQSKCGVAKSHAKPLIVEWPSSERSELESRAKRGLVAVRYEGCDMEMLPRCHVPGRYKYVAITPKSDGLVIRDADDLYANVPLGAAKLEARLSRAASLRVAMTIVGRYEADADEVRAEQLTGDCARATHFVAALTAGAFDFFAEGKAQVGGKATVLGAGGESESASERENITKDGDAVACGKATTHDTEPPSSCGALLRIEVTPFAKRAEVARVAPTPEPEPRPTPPPVAATPTPVFVAPAPAPAPAPASGSGESGAMARIPAGTYQMGSPARVGNANEYPQHAVSVRAFEMDVTEVTAGAYARCVSAGACTAANTGQYCSYGKSEKSNHPINCVDWNQAVAYCAWAGKRLPTEEEWEYAARGSDGRTYPWGNEAPSGQLCWNGEGNRAGSGNRSSTCRVGDFPSGKSPFGLQDMAGNVWEWTSSGTSDDYNKRRATGPGSARVIRGGSWFSFYPSDVRGALRFGFAPSSSDRDLGFRCAR